MFLITEGFKSGSTINKQLLSPLTLADSVTGVIVAQNLHLLLILVKWVIAAECKVY